MKSARQAGWLCLAGGIIFVLLAIALHRLMGITALSVVSVYVAFLFWLSVVMTFLCFVYAVWGLICGYSLKAWNSYERSQAEATRQGAIAECKRQGIPPPHYLNQSIPAHQRNGRGKTQVLHERNSRP